MRNLPSALNPLGLAAALPLALLVLSGCDRPEPTTYQIPKEERAADAPMPTPAAAPTAPASDGGGGGNMQVLPGMAEAADAAGDFTYEVPAGWEEFPATGVRKANFRIEDDNGRAELTVTVFPGDVGGKLANINRWRGQIGLEPMTLEDMSEKVRPFRISNHNGQLVHLQGESESILGGLLGHHGFTWFFKMQGDNATVAAQIGAMEEFLQSVRIEDDHH
ncbi:MAG: hypothetical protein ACLFVC_02230 [Opitutales bacterium]